MKNFFAQHYALTPDQTQAVQHLDDFLASNDSCFILRGYAGTGKTFLLNGIARFFKQTKKQVVFAAPTGRAAKVISERTNAAAYTIHKTIYSSQKLTEYKAKGVEGSESFKFSFGLKENEDNIDTVYIIDEASMISNVYSEGEFFRFGSGHLLDDLLKFVKPNEAGIQRKIIFVGDNAQLPPVKMNVSPALSEKTLGKRLPRTKSYELTEVVRQKKASPILSNATSLRNAIRDEAFYKLKLKYDERVMHSLQASNLAETYRQLRETDGVEGTVIIAYANSTVNGYNKLAREQLFPGISTITQADRVILVSNNYNYEIDLFNGDFATVVEVDDTITHRSVKIKKKDKEGRVETKTIPLSFRQVRLSFEQSNGSSAQVTCHICEQLLYSKERDLTSDEVKALYVDFKIRTPHLRPGSEEFKRALRSDKMFNALRIKFGYAITCHKAQGGEWPAVIVDARGHGAKNNSNYFRWLYTAITRSSEKLYVLDAPDYDNGDALNVVEVIGMPTTEAMPLAPPAARPISPPIAASQTFVAPASVPPESAIEDTGTKSQDSRSQLPPRITKHIPSVSMPMPIKETNMPPSSYTPMFVTGQEPLQNIYLEVLRLLAPTDFVVTNINHNQYHELYSLQKNEVITRVTINYRANGNVSAVRANDLSGQEREIVAALTPLIGFASVSIVTPTVSDPTSGFDFPEPFLEEFYQTIVSKVGAAGVHVTDIKRHSFQEVYTFVRDGEQAVYRFYYRANKQFGTVSPIPTQSSQDLMSIINSLL